MVALARLPDPNALAPPFIPTSRARGPLTMISGEATWVVACTPLRLKARSVIASIAARTIGAYSGTAARHHHVDGQNLPGQRAPARGHAGIRCAPGRRQGIHDGVHLLPGRRYDGKSVRSIRARSRARSDRCSVGNGFHRGGHPGAVLRGFGQGLGRHGAVTPASFDAARILGASRLYAKPKLISGIYTDTIYGQAATSILIRDSRLPDQCHQPRRPRRWVRAPSR